MERPPAPLHGGHGCGDNEAWIRSLFSGQYVVIVIPVCCLADLLTKAKTNKKRTVKKKQNKPEPRGTVVLQR